MPDRQLRILFRVRDRPCLFGMVERPWEDGALEVPLEELEEVWVSAGLRWDEGINTGELPHHCRPDAHGVTWLSLWENW